MKLEIFAILDVKADTFGQPFFMHNTNLATRSFSEACMNPDGEFNKYPLDYVMYKIGDYDDSEGKITGNVPEEIMSAKSAIQLMVLNQKRREKLNKGEEI